MKSLLAVAAAMLSGHAAASPLTDPDIWKTHLTDDLLAFWDDAIAETATQTGALPGVLCNSGALPSIAGPCEGVPPGATEDQQTIVAHSRQIYAYTVAFHMTGDQQYLDIAKAGVDYQIANFLSPDSGLYYESRDAATGGTSPASFVVRQAYGLLGPTFYHYVTGDAAVYDHVASVRSTLNDVFRNPADGSYDRFADRDGIGPVGDHLDQLNTYQTLLSVSAPGPERADILAEAYQTARYLRATYFDEATGLMRMDASDAEGDSSEFGFSIKSFWYIDQVARLAGDAELSAFASGAAKDLMAQAFSAPDGTWATGLNPDGSRKSESVWWMHAEFDQYAAMLAIDDPDLRADVEAAMSYWLDTFVDDTNGGVYLTADLDTDEGNAAQPKHYEWKAGFHSFEHALIGYLSAAAIGDETASLYFLEDGVFGDELALAYGFSGDARQSAADANGIVRVDFSNLTFASVTTSEVPLPGAAVLMLGGLLGAAGVRRRALR